MYKEENKVKRSIRIISAATCMVLVFAQTPAVFAAETSSSSASASSSASSSATVKKSLSLEEAYELFKQSDTYKLVELQNTRDQAVIKGYSEQISNNNETINDDSSSRDSKSDAKYNNKSLKTDKAYAESVYQSNCEARENSTYQEFLNKYYNLKSTEKNVEIAKESLDMKKESLDLAELKYEYGTVSKIDVLTSKISYKQAESNYKSMQNSLKTAKMEFCSYLGIDVNTDITLTSDLTEVALSTVSLEDAIASALENRVEFLEANYKLEEAKETFSSVAAYPKTSATYLKGSVAYNQTLIDCNSVKDEVTIDVTKKYTEMNEKYQALQLDKMNIESAKESYELAKERYELGMSTLSEVQSAQLTVENAQESYQNDILSYNLAVENYEISMGAGTATISF